MHAGDLHVVIVDDGFQHYRLQRDVDILMLHAMHPFGLNGKLIPQGTLREVPRRGLARADVVVIHHADKVKRGDYTQLSPVHGREQYHFRLPRYSI